MTFDTITADRIPVTTAFDGNPAFYLARLVVKAPYLLGDRNIPSGYAAGSGFSFDSAQARLKALGECVERFCAETAVRHLPLVTASIQELTRKQTSYLDPDELRPYHDCASIHERYPRLQSQQSISWVEGWLEQTGERVLVPASACFLPWNPQVREPVVAMGTATGLAAHTSLEQAKQAAYREVIERAALIQSWRLAESRVHRVADVKLPVGIQQFLERHGLHMRSFCLDPFALPTFMVILSRCDGQGLTIGSKSGPLHQRTLEAALDEAIMLQATVRRKSLFTKSEALTSMEHVQRAWTQGPSIIHWYEAKVSSDLRLPEYAPPSADALDHPEPVYFVELTTPAARKAGWRVVRCLVPGACSKESNSRLPQLKNLLRMAPLETMQLTPHPFG
jgi:thiazole/oxazole-forming peptide maturase SagD family component